MTGEKGVLLALRKAPSVCEMASILLPQSPAFVHTWHRLSPPQLVGHLVALRPFPAHTRLDVVAQVLDLHAEHVVLPRREDLEDPALVPTPGRVDDRSELLHVVVLQTPAGEPVRDALRVRPDDPATTTTAASAGRRRIPETGARDGWCPRWVAKLSMPLGCEKDRLTEMPGREMVLQARRLRLRTFSR